MSKVDRLEAELAYEQAAEKYVAAKAANDGKPAAVKKYRDTKATMSKARTVYKGHRDADKTPVAPGDARVSITAIAAKATVEEVGT